MHKKTEGKFNDDQKRKNNLTVEYLLFHICFCCMKWNSICSTWSNDRAFSIFQEWHAFTVKEVEGRITAEEALRYTYKLIFKQDLKEIREWGLFTEREGLMQMGRYHFQILWTLGSPFSFYRTYFQGAKKIIFTACLSGKLKSFLAQTSFQIAPNLFDEQNWFHSSSVIQIPQKTSLAHRAS